MAVPARPFKIRQSRRSPIMAVRAGAMGGPMPDKVSGSNMFKPQYMLGMADEPIRSPAWRYYYP